MASESAPGSPSTAATPPPKRRKIEPPRRDRPSQVVLDKLAASSSNLSVLSPLSARVDLNKVREAKRFAVLQAHHEGCLGSYKSFDSLFGNYLVPVIPSNGLVEQSGKK